MFDKAWPGSEAASYCWAAVEMWHDDCQADHSQHLVPQRPSLTTVSVTPYLELSAPAAVRVKAVQVMLAYRWIS